MNDSETRLGISTIATLQQHSRTFVTTVLPSFKIDTLCRSITLVPGSVLLQRGKAAGQVPFLPSAHAVLTQRHLTCRLQACKDAPSQRPVILVSSS